MTYRGHLSRAEIGLRPPELRSTAITPEHGGVTGHWAGPAQNVGPHSECLALWRGYQDYHMNTHGWVDIAYTGGVCDHGYSLAGRGSGVRTAANGTNSGNQNWYAVCWIGGQGETPTQDAIDAFWAFRKMLREQGGAGSGVNEHADHKPTSCAGTFGDAIKSGGPTSPPTTNPDPEDDEMLQRGDEGDGVKAFQRRMIQWIEGAGRTGKPYDEFLGYGADGDFGPNMEATVKAFQAAYDLPQTGVIQGVTGSILAMYAVSSGGGGDATPHPHAPQKHGHNDLYVTKSEFDGHTHDEGRTGGPQ